MGERERHRVERVGDGLVEATVPPGGGPAPHVHERTDETFYLVHGELEFLSGDKTFYCLGW